MGTGCRYKLLLADDSVTIQRVIELTFADEDVKVIAVGDGQQAIDRVQTERPDIVLADVGMPLRDGYEVAAFIKANPDLAHIPVLLLTGAFEPVDEDRARAAKCNGVLAKPFEPQQLIGRVKELLAGVQPAASAAPSPAAVVQPSHAAPPAEAFPAAPADEDATRPLPMPTLSGALGSAEPPLDTASLDLNPEPAPSDASLDDYFDRLDAAFAHLTGHVPGRDEAGSVRASHGPGPTGEPAANVVWSSAAAQLAAFAEGAPPPKPVPDAGHEAGEVAQPVAGPAAVPVSDAFNALLENRTSAWDGGSPHGRGRNPWRGRRRRVSGGTGAPRRGPARGQGRARHRRAARLHDGRTAGQGRNRANQGIRALAARPRDRWAEGRTAGGPLRRVR